MLEGSKIALRAFDRSHLERTRRWNNDAELCMLLGRSHPVSDLSHESWFTDLVNRADAAFFAIEMKETGAHVGNVWLVDTDLCHRKAEVRILIGEAEARGRGVGSEALRLITDYAFKWLNVSRLYAHVLALNPRARRSFEKAGFTVEGVLKADRWTPNGWSDVACLARLREDRR